GLRGRRLGGRGLLLGRLGGGSLLGGRRLRVRCRLWVLLVCHQLSNRFGVEAALAGHRQGASEVALGGADAGRVLELAGGQLEAEAEDLAPLGADVLDELVVLQVAQFPAGHQTWSSRMTNFVLTGSLWPARRIASRASGSGTPASSNMTRPGFTTATQPSGEPLPEPMRVSAGFFVTGLSGKTLIHTLPPRLILRVMAIRAASIWRLVSQPASRVFSPYSPNSTFCWARDSPGLRPRCCRRNLTRFGDSITG